MTLLYLFAGVLDNNNKLPILHQSVFTLDHRPDISCLTIADRHAVTEFHNLWINRVRISNSYCAITSNVPPEIVIGIRDTSRI